jgi:hypothetical protein
LKALALHYRGDNKDAYDLIYVLRHLRGAFDEIVRRLKLHTDDPSVRKALAVLEADFAEIDSVGPRRVAEFLGGPDDALQADARGLVLDLLEAWNALA